ncbi:MAG: cytochrome c oxidase assembly protein [Betaproteobacteria bacterium]
MDEALAPHDLWHAWSGEVWLWILLGASGSLYFAGVTRLWRESTRGAGISRWQVSAFWLGWSSLVFALLSPLDLLGGALFSAHMVQHEVLMLLAAPLLILGRPLGPFIWALPTRWRRPAATFCSVTGLQATVRVLSIPLLAWIVHAAALWIWHVPALFQAALRSEAIHTAQHLSFFISALLFWWALLRARAGGLHYGTAVIYVFTTGVHSALLGALLTFAATAWYPAYRDTAPLWGLTPLEDQQIGGLIMWVPGGFVYLVAALALLGMWMTGGERGVRKSRDSVAARSTG